MKNISNTKCGLQTIDELLKPIQHNKSSKSSSIPKDPAAILNAAITLLKTIGQKELKNQLPRVAELYRLSGLIVKPDITL